MGVGWGGVRGLPWRGRRTRGRVWGRRGVRLGGAAVSSCPARRNNGEAVGRGWGEGARASRKGETKEPHADCHLHVTRSPPLLSFFPLFLQLWASEGALCTQMWGFSSPLTRGAPTCGHDPGSGAWGGTV